MARGTALSAILQMLKAELSVDLDSTVAPGGDEVLKVQLSNTQKWLALRYDWPFLEIWRDVNMVAGTRYYDFPVTSSVSDFEIGRPIVAECYWSTLWNPIDLGITKAEYNLFNPDLSQKADPVERWQLYRGNTLQFEVWPMPATTTKVRLTGQKTLPVLAGNSDTAELDDLLIAQWTAARLLARFKSTDAQAMLTQAQTTLNQLRAGYTAASSVFSMNGRSASRSRNPNRPTVAVNYTP